MKKNEKGFTLVELIVTIVIISILIGVTIGGVTQWVNKARVNTDIQNCQQMRRAIEAVALTKTFPSIDEPYSWICISNSNDTYENLFNYSICITADRNVDNHKTVFQECVYEAVVERDTGKNGLNQLPIEVKTGGRLFIMIGVDENGCFTNCKVGLCDASLVVSNSRENARKLGLLYHPLYETTEEYKSVLDKIFYDGSYKFYE